MTDQSLEQLNQLVGSWTTEATHPDVPGVTVHGSTTFEWLEGERFLIQRSRNDHPDFPDAISIIGVMDADRAEDTAADTGELAMHYFDSRGVFRVYATQVDEHAWRWWMNAPGFSQRITCTFEDGGDTMAGTSQLCQDDVTWADDLAITYRRRRS